jgi:hypothetical protein
MANLPPFWGPAEGVDSKDYLFMMAGDTPVSTPTSLLGHAVTSPSADSSDALTVTRVELRNGRIKTLVRTKRAAEVRSRTYTIGFPAGSLWTPAQQLAFKRNCRRTFFMKYLCSSEARFNHADIFPDGLLDEPVEEGDLITVDDENVISSTSVLTVTEKLRLWAQGYEIIYTNADTPIVQLFSSAFTTVDCPGCDEGVGLGIIVGGGDGTAAPEGFLTDDRFGSAPTGLPIGGTLTDFAYALATKGDVIVAGTADSPVAASTAGTLRVSQDGGVSFTAVSGITSPIFGIAYFGSTIIAVGGTGAGAPVMFVSFDKGTSWTQITSTILSGLTTAATAIASDVEADNFYIVGEGGMLIKGRFIGDSVMLSNITANLPGGPGALNTVNVFSKDFIAVGGAANYYAESLDGGTTWTQPAVPGSAAVVGIAGNEHRAIVATADGLHVRDLFTDFVYTTLVLENGQVVTGNYTSVNMNVEDDFNIFMATTDDAEVVFGKPFYPNA